MLLLLLLVGVEVAVVIIVAWLCLFCLSSRVPNLLS